MDELLDLTGELAFLGGELLDPACDGLEREQGAAELGVVPAIGPSGGQAREQTSGAERAQFAADRLGGRDQQVAQLAVSGRSGGDGAFASREQRPHCFACAARTRDRGTVVAEYVASGTDRVELVSLAARATLTPQPGDLEHLLAAAGQKACQSCSVRAGTFDREGAAAARMPLGKLKRLGVAARVGGHHRLEHHHAGANLDDRERVRVSMRVDANHVVQLICEHPKRPPAQVGGHVPVPAWGVEPRAAEL